MEVAQRNDRSQSLQNIYYKIFLAKSERLISNITFTCHKALIKSVMTYALSAWELATLTILAKQDSSQHWKFSKMPTGLRLAHGNQTSVRG
jgi:hypothetical protein